MHIIANKPKKLYHITKKENGFCYDSSVYYNINALSERLEFQYHSVSLHFSESTDIEDVLYQNPGIPTVLKIVFSHLPEFSITSSLGRMWVKLNDGC